MDLSQYKSGYYARIIRGKNDSDFLHLSNDPNREIIMVMGEDGINAISGKSSKEMFDSIGYDEAYLTWLVKNGTKFKIVLLNDENPLPATWDNLLKVVKNHYPQVYDKFAKWADLLTKTPYDEIENQAGYTFAEVNQKGEADSRFMSVDKYQTAPDTLANARAFMYFSMQLRELYSGDGYAYDEKGNRQVREYFLDNRAIKDEIILDLPMPEIFCERAALARDLARQAGDELSKIFNNKTELHTEFKTDNSPVTIADKMSESLITQALREKFPNDSIIGEEGANIIGNSGYSWAIDPLDGTRNFSKGIPAYSISIGCMHNGEPLFGVVYMPEIGKQGTLFIAEKNKGAYCNNTPIKVSAEEDISKCNISIRRSKDSETETMMRELIARAGSCKHLGTTAGELALTAKGGYDISAYRYSIWDILAGSVLITEAGGKITDKNGNNIDWASTDRNTIVVTNKVLHNQVIDLLKQKNKLHAR
ncbi:MAG: inositol monophosphatase [Clostridiales bacterium]|nr:inositol monophosphatase [Clostridiales bacterium]